MAIEHKRGDCWGKENLAQLLAQYRTTIISRAEMGRMYGGVSGEQIRQLLCQALRRELGNAYCREHAKAGELLMSPREFYADVVTQIRSLEADRHKKRREAKKASTSNLSK